MTANGKGNELEDRVEQIRSEAEDNLRDLTRSARSSADDVKKEAVRLLQAAADTIRREARERGANKDVRGGADEVAHGLEQAAHYLKKNSFEDMGEDVSRTVKKNPLRTLAIVFVVGTIIGMMLRGDNDNHRR